MDSSNKQTTPASISPNIPEKTPSPKSGPLNDATKLGYDCFKFCNVNPYEMCPNHPNVPSFACMPCNH